MSSPTLVTDSSDLATAGADWFCSHCGSGNRGDGERCNSCAAPRYGNPDEDHPVLKGGHKDGVIGDDPWEDGWDPELAGIARGADDPLPESEWDPELDAVGRQADEPPIQEVWADINAGKVHLDDPTERQRWTREWQAKLSVAAVIGMVLLGFTICAL